MYYGIIKASATLYGLSGKIHVVTKGHETIDGADAEMKAKIKALPRCIYLSMYPFDTAVVHWPDLDDNEKSLMTIRDGYWGTVVLLCEGQPFIQGKQEVRS